MPESKITAVRYHDISCGHRVVGHESKCRYFHGHNYRIHFTVVAGKSQSELDELGRVIDFGVIKAELCEWLEREWDHRFLMWEEDPYLPNFNEDIFPGAGILLVPFNPTAENMALYLIEKVGPPLLGKLGVVLEKVVIEETRKCSVEAAHA